MAGPKQKQKPAPAKSKEVPNHGGGGGFGGFTGFATISIAGSSIQVVAYTMLNPVHNSIFLFSRGEKMTVLLYPDRKSNKVEFRDLIRLIKLHYDL